MSVGITALTRAESLLLVPLLLVPLALWLRGPAMRRRLQLLAIAVGATLLTIAPWVGYNLARFERPVFLSSNLEPTLLSETLIESVLHTIERYRHRVIAEGIDPSTLWRRPLA